MSALCLNSVIGSILIWKSVLIIIPSLFNSNNLVYVFVTGHNLRIHTHSSQAYNTTYKTSLGATHTVIYVRSCSGPHFALSMIPGITDTLMYEVNTSIIIAHPRKKRPNSLTVCNGVGPHGWKKPQKDHIQKICGANIGAVL